MLRLLCSVFFCALCLGGFAKAHPHVFVDAHGGFIFDDAGKLTALRVSWTYDEFTTLFLFDGLNLDEDRDGLLNESDIAAVIKAETVWDPEYKGDVYLEVAGKDYPLGRPQAAGAIFENNRVEVHFDLPLSQPVTVSNTPAYLRLYDPTYYYAYTILPMPQPLDLPDGCEAQIIAFKADAAQSALQQQLSALSQEETPTQQDVGRVFSDKVALICG